MMASESRQRIRKGILFALVVAAVCFVLFGLLTLQVQRETPTVLLDRALALELYRTITPLRAEVFKIVTLFGYQVLYLLAITFGALLLWRRERLFFAMLVLAIAGGLLLNSLLKLWIARPRPVFPNPILLEIHFSYPSGHAMTALIAYGFAAYLLCLGLQRLTTRSLVIFTAVLLTVLVGISRLYLGVHYLSDVVGGFLAGGVWLALCIALTEMLLRRSSLSNTTHT